MHYTFNFQILMSRLAHVLLFCSLLLVVRTASAQTGGVPPAQYNALVSLYNATGGINWSINDNWLSTQPVENWYGVVVSNGNVVGLNLSFNSLTGSIPASIANLPLTDMFVDGNQLTSIAGLPNSLVTLDFNSNQITSVASFPTTLKTLNAFSNKLTSLPALPTSLIGINVSNNLITWLPKLPASLVSLVCSFNQLAIVPKLPNSLVTLDCSNNRIFALPKLSTSLSNLIASNNKLIALPSFPGTLRTIDVRNNELLLLPNLPAGLLFLQVDFNNLFTLPALPVNPTLFISVSNNRLTFKDLEPIIGRFNGVARFYAPQADVDFSYSQTANEGANITLSANLIDHTANTRYVWFKNETEKVSDTLSVPTFKIIHAQLADSGVYTTKISNKNVPGLILNRKPVTITIKSIWSAPSIASESEMNMSVYPNPVVSSLQLTKPSNWSNDVTVSITSETSTLPVYQATHSFDENIDLSHLATGKYIITVSDGKQLKSLHIVKQ